MENKWMKWGYGESPEEAEYARATNTRGIVTMLTESISEDDQRPTIHLGLGDPATIECFRTSPAAEEALIEAIRSSKFNCYAPSFGVLSARRAIADYLSRDLPYQLSPNDVYVTSGCKTSIQIVLKALVRPGANILLPRPAFPGYEYTADFCSLEVRYYNLLPENDWEINLDHVEALADENTIALVITNPGNPCPNVYTYEHLKNVAETARKLMISVIADEVYGHLAYGENPFIPMGVFGSIVPVFSLGSISKSWMVSGWRFGWLVTCDPTGFFQKVGLVDSIKKLVNYYTDPATIIQGAIPGIIEKTPRDFLPRIINMLKEASEICYAKIKEIPCLTCPCKPQGSMFVMVKLNLTLFEDIKDDLEFCLKLAKEESVITMPGITVGLKNWFRITLATELTFLEDGFKRIKAFCRRHEKLQ